MTRDDQIQRLLIKAWQLRGQGNYEASKNILQEAQLLCKDDEHNYLGRIDHIKMQHQYDGHNYLEAIKFCKKAIAHYTTAKNSNKIAHSTRHLADIQTKLNQLDKAFTNYLYALKIYNKHPKTHPGDLANALRGYALLLEKTGKQDEALLNWKSVLELYTQLGIQEGVDEAKFKILHLSGTNN